MSVDSRLVAYGLAQAGQGAPVPLMIKWHDTGKTEEGVFAVNDAGQSFWVTDVTDEPFPFEKQVSSAVVQPSMPTEVATRLHRYRPPLPDYAQASAMFTNFAQSLQASQQGHAQWTQIQQVDSLWVNSQIQASSMTNALTQILGDMRTLSAEASGATATLASNVSGPAGESAQNQGAAVQSTAQNMQSAASEGQMRHNQLHAVLSDFFSHTRATSPRRPSMRRSVRCSRSSTPTSPMRKTGVG
ncbi:hypothetical protein NESM_000787300 [Novymonas esmeraldas]|uniref:Uncharacterized protein n=1 Tax=Novymonas esmeraldas TaxID=1808958 RepID=A0AAW0EWB6_9TRYP